MGCIAAWFNGSIGEDGRQAARTTARPANTPFDGVQVWSLPPFGDQDLSGGPTPPSVVATIRITPGTCKSGIGAIHGICDFWVGSS